MKPEPTDQPVVAEPHPFRPMHQSRMCWDCDRRENDPIHTAPAAAQPVGSAIMYEDQLPANMPQEDYDKWYAQSRLSDGNIGVRVGPAYPFAVPTTDARERAREIVGSSTETRYITPENYVDVLCRESDLIDRIAAALSSTTPAVSGPLDAWRSIESIPKDGTTFRAYSPDFVHPDFNPWGSVECVFDGEKFIGAIWDGQFDCWNTVEVNPTLWKPIGDTPSYPRKGGPR